MYPTTQSTAKTVVDLTGSTDRSVSSCRPHDFLENKPSPHVVWLATTPRSPPLFTDSIDDVQRDLLTDPTRLSDHADPTPATGSSHDQLVLVGDSFCPPASHGTDTSDMKDFLTNLTDDVPKKDAKQKKMLMAPGHKLMWIIFAKKNVPANICGYGPKSFYMMTRTCTTPTYHFLHLNTPPPPLPFCCEFLYFITVLSISVSLVVSTAFGLAKHLNKLTGLKIPCCELFFIFLILFPAPGAAATQGLANHHNSSIQVVVHTNTNASTAMVAVDTVTSWAQLVTACNRTSANITLSPTFKMGVYTHEIDFRLVLYTWLSELETVPQIPCYLLALSGPCTCLSVCLPVCLSVRLSASLILYCI
jgi:hypothetical protein